MYQVIKIMHWLEYLEFNVNFVQKSTPKIF